MWELKGVKASKPEEVEEGLSTGYEPFAVSTNINGFITIWMKRFIIEGEVIEVTDAVYSKPDKPDKRPSRRTAKGTKG